MVNKKKLFEALKEEFEAKAQLKAERRKLNRLVDFKRLDKVAAKEEEKKQKHTQKERENEEHMKAVRMREIERQEAKENKLKTTGDARFLGFVAWSKGTTLSDLDFPAKYTPPKPTFKWSGTPAEVCTSLLRAESKSSNDNHWPDWANLDGPSRYVIDGGEAKAMVKALGQLYINRQKAVLTELASRTQMLNPGCVSPTDAGKAVLEAYATKLGLSLDFQQPSAPSMPSP